MGICQTTPRRAGFPACRFIGLSSPVFPRATGKSPEPADRNVCPRAPDGPSAPAPPQESGGEISPAWQTGRVNDYERIAGVIRYLDENHTDQPDLAVLADRAGLSPFHFHRLFAAWA